MWRNGDKSISNAERAKSVGNMDELPRATYHDWIRQLKESGLQTQVDEVSIPIETSRGCWYGQKSHCIFCGLNGESLNFRRKSPERVLNELEEILQYGIRNIYAVDLIFPLDYFKSVLPVLAERRWPIAIFFEAKANLTREQLLALRNAGVNQLQPGIESLNSQLLNILRKGFSAYQNIRLLKWAAELGIATEWNLLVGIPGAKASDYHEMTQIVPYLVHLRAPTVGCSRIRVDRFSPLEYRAAKFGIIHLIPAPAYRWVYGLPDETLRDIAYFFESNWPTPPDADDAIRLLSKEVEQWHSTKGEATFIALIDRDRSLLLFDRRPCAVDRYKRLSGIEATVFHLCDEGATLDRIAATVKRDVETVKDILDKLVAKKWVLFIDNRYLSLATRLDHVVSPDKVPEPILGDVAHAIQKARMRSMWKTINQYEIPKRHRQRNPMTTSILVDSEAGELLKEIDVNPYVPI